MVRAIVAPNLAYPVILGGPFLSSNKIVIDHEFGRVVAKDAKYQLLPVLQEDPTTQDEQHARKKIWSLEDVLPELRDQVKGRKV